MRNFFRRKKLEEKKTVYKVVFCDENDISTKFGEYNTYDSYQTADHVIRMNWNKRESARIRDGYEIDSMWILIETVNE